MILPHKSESINDQGILIGRIYCLYLHGPSSLNYGIDLRSGKWGMAEDSGGSGGGGVGGEGFF